MAQQKRISTMATMTKSDEVQVLRKFVESIDKNSYLGDFFQGCVPFFESAVRNDCVFAHADNLRGNEDELRAVKAEIVAQKKFLADLKLEADRMEAKKVQAEREIASLKRDFVSVARAVADKVASIEHTLR
jgi:hypothetical protein